MTRNMQFVCKYVVIVKLKTEEYASTNFSQGSSVKCYPYSLCSSCGHRTRFNSFSGSTSVLHKHLQQYHPTVWEKITEKINGKTSFMSGIKY